MINHDARKECEILANLIVSHTEFIIHQWIDLVYQHIPAARTYTREEVANQLLHLLQNIVKTLEGGAGGSGESSQAPIVMDKVGVQHGRDRVTFKDFTALDVAREYFLLRSVIKRLCTEEGLVDSVPLDLITEVIEAATLGAIEEFQQGVEELYRKLVTTLVHDLRAPIGVAFGVLDLVVLDPRHRPEQTKLRDTAKRNLRRSLAMVDELLDLERLRAGAGIMMRFEEEALNEHILNLVAEANYIYDHKVEAVVPSHPVRGVFDIALILRTMENLVANAVKWGAPDTPVRVVVEDSDSRVRVVVHNEGPPIPPEHRTDVFQLFSRIGASEYRGKGWGLGLTLVDIVSRGHGGARILESSEEQGTRIGMLLEKAYRKAGETQVQLFDAAPSAGPASST